MGNDVFTARARLERLVEVVSRCRGQGHSYRIKLEPTGWTVGVGLYDKTNGWYGQGLEAADLDIRVAVNSLFEKFLRLHRQEIEDLKGRLAVQESIVRDIGKLGLWEE